MYKREVNEKLSGLYRMNRLKEDERFKIIRLFTQYYHGEVNELQVWDEIIKILGKGEHLEEFDCFF